MAEALRVVGLGAGGHAKAVVDILRLDGRYEIVGLLDPRADLRGGSAYGLSVLGDDDRLPELARDGVGHAFIGLGSSGDLRPRRALYELARAHGLEVVDAVHPKATVSPSATFGRGVTLMAGAIVNPDARLGANVIVNTGAIVEHDCVLGDHAHVATGARLGGGVEVGSGTHIGLGASVNQGIRVGRSSIIGAGAVVVDDVGDLVVVAGVPARVLRRVEA
jgi:sugar O-acyltransferase (sialic acid O-acetyltransferase NeuD family)